MSEPAWLRDVFDAFEGCALDSPADRARLGDAIVAKLTELAHPIAACISSAARAHHKTRVIRDDAGDLATQIGRNGATSVLMLLERK